MACALLRSDHTSNISHYEREDALVAAIAEEFGLAEPDDTIRFHVQFALRIQLGAAHAADPHAAVVAGFRLLDEGWRRGGYAESIQ